MLPSALYFTLNTHLQLTMFASEGIFANVYVLLSNIDFISASAASFQCTACTEVIASLYDCGSTAVTISAYSSDALSPNVLSSITLLLILFLFDLVCIVIGCVCDNLLACCCWYSRNASVYTSC